MKIKLELDLDLTPWQRRVARWGVVLGVAIGATGLGMAFAWTDTTWIKPGGPVSASSLLQNITELQRQIGDPLCPPGYTAAPGAPLDGGGGIIACSNGVDEVVRVGSQTVAFWIDRYEASVFGSRDASGAQYGATSATGAAGTYPPSFPVTGQRAAGAFQPLYAISKSGVQPSAALTWLQALEACHSSGKRLPAGEEWMRAASGTPDGNGCHTTATGPRATGAGSCVSAWGAEDMIGNMAELTGEWFAAPYGGDASAVGTVVPWPVGYGSDQTYDVLSSAYSLQGGFVNGLPAVGLRGGNWLAGTGAGVFSFNLAQGPSNADPHNGFRCVTPR